MVEIASETPKRSPRPSRVRSDEETLAVILDAAGQEFQANGYEATCIAEVAERAGVSTKTLSAWYHKGRPVRQRDLGPHRAVHPGNRLRRARFARRGDCDRADADDSGR